MSWPCSFLAPSARPFKVLLLAVAVALSVLISLDRLLKVAKYCRLSVREWASGHRPEHNFKIRRLPDPHREGHRFPYVAVQVLP